MNVQHKGKMCSKTHLSLAVSENLLNVNGSQALTWASTWEARKKRTSLTLKSALKHITSQNNEIETVEKNNDTKRWILEHMNLIYETLYQRRKKTEKAQELALSRLAQATNTKYHGQGHWNNKNVFSISSGCWKSGVKVPAGLVSSDPLFLTCRRPPLFIMHGPGLASGHVQRVTSLGSLPPL